MHPFARRYSRRLLLASTALSLIAFCQVQAQSQDQTAAQSPTSLREYLDPSRFRVASDSFVVLMQNVPRGWQRITMAREADGWLLTDAVSIDNMVSQESRVVIDESLQERSLRQSGTIMQREMQISLDWRNGRVVGTAQTPASGPAGRATIDTAIAGHVYDDNAITPLLSAVRWHEGLNVAFDVLSSGKGTIDRYQLAVLGTEVVAVPAGQFDTWKAELRLARSRVLVNVTKLPPYRIVRISNGPSFEMHLVR